MELHQLAGGAPVKCFRSPEAPILAWKGCVMLSTLSGCEELYICKNDEAAVWAGHPEKTKETYEELGPSTIHRLIPRQF